MAGEIIRPSALPARANPVASEIVPSDNGLEVGGVTIAALVNAARPLATQAEAIAGTDPSKTMTPLTTRQAIDAVVPPMVPAITAARDAALVDIAAAKNDALVAVDVYVDEAEDARDAAAAYANTAVQGGTGNQYGVVTGLSAMNIPAGVTSFYAPGYSAIGDGGGWKVKEVTEDGTTLLAWQVRTNSGTRRWEITPGKKTVIPQVFGAKGDGVQDDQPAILKAANYLWTKFGGGTIFLPDGDYLVDSTIGLAGFSNITLCGSGWGSRIIASASLNGSNQATKNNIISANNFSGPVTSHDGYPHKNIVIRDLLIDGTLQSAAGIPPDTFVGYSLAGFEVLNVDFVRVTNVKFVKCFGNGLVFGTQDPRQKNGVYQNGLRGCVAEDNWFEEVCRGLLPQYSSTTSPGGLTGSVIQAGSTLAVSIRNNTCIKPGGPFLDIFNGDGAVIDGNIVDGFSYTPGGHSPLAAALFQQTVGTIRSDFGLARSWIVNNRCHGIILNGNMSANFFNGNTPTPGPKNCTVAGNKIINPVGNVPTTAPAIGASGATYENTLTRPIYIFVVGGSGVALERRRGTDGSFTAYTPGYLTSILLAAGDAVKLSYTVAPTAWSWQIAPNGFSAGIQLTGGSISGVSGTVSGNTVKDNTVVAPGQGCLNVTDGFSNAIKDNHLEQPFFASSGPFISMSTGFDQAGCGAQENDLCGNEFFDTRSPKFSTSNIQFVTSGTLRNYNNVISDNRLENTTSTPIVVNSGQDYIKNNHGPGRHLPVLTSPAVAATNVELLNPFPYDCRVLVAGGTVTAIAIGQPGATQVYGATSGLVHVRNREVIKITYSSAPTTFNWFAE